MSMQKVAETTAADKPSRQSAIEEAWNRRRGNTWLIVTDLLYAAVAFFFGRTHVLLGAYPLAIAQLSALRGRVWLSLAAAVLGALTMGRAGLVYALASVITVLLRVVVSGTGHAREERAAVPLFSEGRWLRVSAAVIGGFICAVYEVLLEGLSLTAVLYGASMTLLCGAVCFLFSGLDACAVSLRELLLGQAPLFDGVRCHGGSLRAGIEYQLALCAYIFFAALSLSGAVLLGISFAYVLAAALTLLAARRFGALRAMAVGFVSLLGLSPVHAVAYALGGLAAGVLFPLGGAVALLASVSAVGAWSAASGGLAAFVATLPEFAITAMVFFPLSRRLHAEVRLERARATEQSATDMVGTMALSFRAEGYGSVRRLEGALGALSPLLSRLYEERMPEVSEYRALLSDVTDELCREGVALPADAAALGALLDALSVRLFGGAPLTEQSLLPLGGDAAFRRAFLTVYERRLGAWQGARARGCADDGAKLCEAVAKMMNEARLRDEREMAPDTALSRQLTELLAPHGLAGGVIRAFGDRRKYIACAAEDATGERISSPQLLEAIESTAGLRLGKPAFFRKETMALMECRAAPRYRVEAATASAARSSEEVSGDSAACFESADGCCYLVLSDGMGSGEEAHRTSAFSVDYLSRMMGTGCSEGTVLYLLNRLIRGRSEECSATVDMFSFDLLTGEGVFYKSGAAASYIKRTGSLFRIRSRTAPVGLLRALDAERIRVEVQPEDLVILLSDGICGAPEDDPWLIELLNRPHTDDLRAFADYILQEASRRAVSRDDMTVLVARITAA